MSLWIHAYYWIASACFLLGGFVLGVLHERERQRTAAQQEEDSAR